MRGSGGWDRDNQIGGAHDHEGAQRVGRVLGPAKDCSSIGSALIPACDIIGGTVEDSHEFFPLFILITTKKSSTILIGASFHRSPRSRSVLFSEKRKKFQFPRENLRDLERERVREMAQISLQAYHGDTKVRVEPRPPPSPSSSKPYSSLLIDTG